MLLLVLKSWKIWRMQLVILYFIDAHELLLEVEMLGRIFDKSFAHLGN